MNSDSQLVMETLAGERSSYDELTRRWSVRVCSYVASRVRNSHITEELAQEAFLKTLDKKLSRAAAYQATVPVFGKGVIFDA